MARDFSWRDLWSLTRFQDQGFFLDNTLELTYRPSLFTSVLLSLVSPSTGYCTALQPLNSASPERLVGQIHRSSGESSAHLTFLAPAKQITHPGMKSLLSHLCRQAGEHGALQVLGEIDRSLGMENLFYQVGFRPYAEQDIWLAPSALGPREGRPAWIPLTRRHDQEVSTLYERVVPGKVRQVEPPPQMNKLQGLIAWQGGSLVGFVAVHFGPNAVLMDPFFDPGIDHPGSHLPAVIRALPYHRSRKVYVRVRGYQGRLNTALETLGGERTCQQLAVVKNLAVPYGSSQKLNLRSFEKQPDVTTPISNLEIDG